MEKDFRLEDFDRSSLGENILVVIDGDGNLGFASIMKREWIRESKLPYPDLSFIAKYLHILSVDIQRRLTKLLQQIIAQTNHLLIR